METVSEGENRRPYVTGKEECENTHVLTSSMTELVTVAPPTLSSSMTMVRHKCVFIVVVRRVLSPGDRSAALLGAATWRVRIIARLNETTFNDELESQQSNKGRVD